MIVVDYLQLLQGSSRQSNENRVNEISEITRGLKTLAKELNLPGLALTTLSRQVATRGDKSPQLSDLRDTCDKEVRPHGYTQSNHVHIVGHRLVDIKKSMLSA